MRVSKRIIPLPTVGSSRLIAILGAEVRDVRDARTLAQVGGGVASAQRRLDLFSRVSADVAAPDMAAPRWPKWGLVPC